LWITHNIIVLNKNSIIILKDYEMLPRGFTSWSYLEHTP